ncbi:MAG TPA: His/Gly/Thr/Pro-type tRNA ligase C-terminal domain-containing protein, partial [Terriglobales bacterium]|nr:His/Gly/Thr/Pro-type tRNA ligase C-terminal domain-containing protein [Terriglobales bacterium]
LTVEATAASRPAGPLAVYVAWMGESARREATLLAGALRRRGVGTEISYQPVKLKKAMGAASRLRVRYTIIIGEEEIASGNYQVKDMATGEQQSVSDGDIAGFLQEKLREPRPVPQGGMAGQK